MTKTVKFICCSSYDFIAENTGEQIKGISCKCYDPESKKILKVKTSKSINADFGDDIEVNVVLNGNFVTYEYVA